VCHRRWPSPGKVGLSKIVARWVESPSCMERPSAWRIARRGRNEPTPERIAKETASLRRRRLTGKHIAAETGVSRRDATGDGHRITGDRTGQSNSRGIGWGCVHLVIDDNSRLAHWEISP